MQILSLTTLVSSNRSALSRLEKEMNLLQVVDLQRAALGSGFE